MKKYRKPSCLSEGHVRGIVPLAAASLAGITVAEAAGAALIGAAVGLGLGGGRDFKSLETKSLNKQKLVAI